MPRRSDVRRGDRGYTLIELLIGTVLLGIIAGAMYDLVIATDRGFSLVQGQIETQQTARMAVSDMVGDLQQSDAGSSLTGGVSASKIAIVCAPVQIAQTYVVVENGDDLASGETGLELYATGKALTDTWERITISPAAQFSSMPCASGGHPAGVRVDLAQPLAHAYPYGTVLSGAAVYYTLNPGRLPETVSRGASPGCTGVAGCGHLLAANVAGFTYAGTGGALAAASEGGATQVTVSMTSAHACPFAAGSTIVVSGGANPTTAAVTGDSVDLSSATCALALGQPLGSTYGSGAPVALFPGTLSPVVIADAHAGEDSVTVQNAVRAVAPFTPGDIVVYVTANASTPPEVRAVTSVVLGADLTTTTVSFGAVDDFLTADPVYFDHTGASSVLYRWGTFPVGVISVIQAGALGGFQTQQTTLFTQVAPRNCCR